MREPSRYTVAVTLQPHHSGATETRIALIVILVALALFAFLLWL